MSAVFWESLAVGLLLLAATLYLGRMGWRKLRVLREAGRLKTGSACGSGGGGCHCSGGDSATTDGRSCIPGSR